MTTIQRPPAGSKPPVRDVRVPPAVRALCSLSRVDYADAYVVDTGATGSCTAEEWVRAVLEEAPISMRTRLLAGWSALGLKLDLLGARASVLGWEVRRSRRDAVVLGAASRIGMPAELVLQRRKASLVFATFVEQQNLAARAAWATVEPVHVPIVRSLLADVAAKAR